MSKARPLRTARKAKPSRASRPRRRVTLAGVLRVVATVVVGIIVAEVAIVTLAHPWYSHWGATKEEVAMELPGDELAPDAKDVDTRAITIHAPASDVWKWIVQIGQGRGGFYSYTWIENALFGCDIQNTNYILDQYQTLNVGDVIRLSKNDTPPPMPVLAVEPGKRLTLGGPDWLETFYLVEQGKTLTRLIVRTRMDWDGVGGWLGTRLLVAPGDFIMEQKMLRGIRERAERGRI